MSTMPDPFQLIRIWQSPDYVPDPDPAPYYAHQWPELLGQCRDAIERRRAAYPAMIERGAITAELADRDLAAWELLVAEWLWIISGEGAPPPTCTITDRIAALDLAKSRVDQELARGNNGFDIVRQGHLVAALRWHLTRERFDEPAVYFCARINHQHRREQGRKFCQKCERWQYDSCQICPDTACWLRKAMAA